ncbi:MAG: phosphatase PAP2 family protein, partial [Actinomycetota bacterium]|nr:phosphatase PAP2 family protein [Actinomycetota bacterium]
RPYLVVMTLAAATAAVTCAVALALDLPLRDPDGVAGPAYVRLPLVIALLFALDIVPRAVARNRRLGGLWRALVGVVRERWTWRRARLVLAGLISFYLVYVGYRNLKSFLPFARDGVADDALLDLDRAMGLGTEPSVLLHTVLGTGVSAHVLSVVYVFFLIFVPISLGAALVWTRDLRRGAWWVTALCVNWVLGVISYYVLPSLGPVFAEPALFAALPDTGVSDLQAALWRHRVEVLADPHATSNVHGIAGFASLHVSIVFSAALMAQLLGLARFVRWALWVFVALTVLATIYFGWHYVVDDVAGFAIGAAAVWLGAVATGHAGRLRGGRGRGRSPVSGPTEVQQYRAHG